MYDGSRQSNNFTANAGGVGSTARVAISDVALKQANIDEVRAVTGHEIGHYVLKHTWYGIAVFSILAIVLFFIADRLFPSFARAFGTSARIGEPRGVPVLLFMVSLFGLLAAPLFNTFARTIETQADRYSLEAENLPDALSTALVGRLAAVEPTQTVATVAVEGNLRVEQDAIKVQLRTQPGMPYDAAALDADIRAVYGMGFFDQVDADVSPAGPGQVAVVFRVKERPLVRLTPNVSK